jgi:hypothetical protein
MILLPAQIKENSSSVQDFGFPNTSDESPDSSTFVVQETKTMVNAGDYQIYDC